MTFPWFGADKISLYQDAVWRSRYLCNIRLIDLYGLITITLCAAGSSPFIDAVWRRCQRPQYYMRDSVDNTTSLVFIFTIIRQTITQVVFYRNLKVNEGIDALNFHQACPPHLQPGWNLFISFLVGHVFMHIEHWAACCSSRYNWLEEKGRTKKLS